LIRINSPWNSILPRLSMSKYLGVIDVYHPISFYILTSINPPLNSMSRLQIPRPHSSHIYVPYGTLKYSLSPARSSSARRFSIILVLICVSLVSVLLFPSHFLGIPYHLLISSRELLSHQSSVQGEETHMASQTRKSLHNQPCDSLRPPALPPLLVPWDLPILI
jgi:hypothetical protein